VLVDLGHPAHFHLFKHAIAELNATGDTVHVLARPKDVLINLLQQAGVEHTVTGVPRRGMLSLIKTMWRTYNTAIRLARRERFDLLVGTSVVAGPVARRTGGRSIIFNEDDAKAVPLFARLAYPWAHFIATPQCLAFEDYGRRHLTYPGYQELAYLHPHRFQPDPDVRKLLGLAEDEAYFVVRLVALTAHHDVGQKGMGYREARQVVDLLQRHGRVFISAERELEADLAELRLPTPPEAALDVLAGADIVVGDSQTMAAEAAVLGTPALRCNTFVGRLSYLEELERRWKLTAGVHPSEFHRVLDILSEWLAKPDLKHIWHQRRRAMLDECVDVTQWIVSTLRRLASEAPPPGPQAGSAS
jgi:predicted glycosyltransferase